MWSISLSIIPLQLDRTFSSHIQPCTSLTQMLNAIFIHTFILSIYPLLFTYPHKVSLCAGGKLARVWFRLEIITPDRVYKRQKVNYFIKLKQLTNDLITKLYC